MSSSEFLHGILAFLRFLPSPQSPDKADRERRRARGGVMSRFSRSTVRRWSGLVSVALVFTFVAGCGGRELPLDPSESGSSAPPTGAAGSSESQRPAPTLPPNFPPAPSEGAGAATLAITAFELSLQGESQGAYTYMPTLGPKLAARVLRIFPASSSTGTTGPCSLPKTPRRAKAV
jgi:hypothetical protein